MHYSLHFHHLPAKLNLLIPRHTDPSVPNLVSPSSSRGPQPGLCFPDRLSWPRSPHGSEPDKAHISGLLLDLETENGSVRLTRLLPYQDVDQTLPVDNDFFTPINLSNERDEQLLTVKPKLNRVKKIEQSFPWLSVRKVFVFVPRRGQFHRKDKKMPSFPLEVDFTEKLLIDRRHCKVDLKMVKMLLWHGPTQQFIGNGFSRYSVSY